jgi:hypothetical protein
MSDPILPQDEGIPSGRVLQTPSKYRLIYQLIDIMMKRVYHPKPLHLKESSVVAPKYYTVGDSARYEETKTA